MLGLLNAIRRILICGAAALLTASAGGGAIYHYSEAFAGSVDAPYMLNSGDKMRVLVFGQDNLSNIYAVDGAGQISMPLIGNVPVAGRTTAELEVDFARRLQNGYVREPHVSIEVEQYRPFFVLGEVAQAGQFPYVNGLTAQNAVAIAGGFSPRATRDGVEITRQSEGKSITGFVPLTYPVRPGDTVVVRERWF